MDLNLAFVVAHYDHAGKVADDLFNLVRYVAGLTPRVVFVSTGIASDEVARLAPFAKVIARDNVGYDFWSYKLGIHALGNVNELSRLVLFNSSFLTLSPEKLCAAFLTPVTGEALRGLTVSREVSLHAQSYWLAFEGAALLQSPEFAQWWREMTPISDRQTVIHRYEIGMSAHFARLGVPIKSSFIASNAQRLLAVWRAIDARIVSVNLPEQPTLRSIQVDLEVSTQLNQTHFLWDALLDTYSILKLELLRTNPFGLNLAPLFNAAGKDISLRTMLQDALS